MSRSVIFKTLWLVSERDGMGRVLQFSPTKTMLLGENGTGKSRITKSLFWAFGCEPPKRKAARWDVDTITGLDFSLGNKSYFILRNRSELSLFAEDELLFCTQKRSEWDKRMGQLFGYHLKLQRHEGNSEQAGVEYLTLPFYVDQDGSWSGEWGTYQRLSQFKAWKNPTFEAFTGQRLNAYFEVKQRRDDMNNVWGAKRRDYDAHLAAFKRVEEVLPSDLPVLDSQQFRDELATLGALASQTYKEQANARAKLLATISTRERLRSDLQLAASAQRELNQDMIFLTDIPEGLLECPTCGTQHENSFHAKLQLSQDSDTMSALVSELRNRVDSLEAEEANLVASLHKVDGSLAKIHQDTLEKQAELQVTDLLAAHSKRTLGEAVEKVSSSMVDELAVYAAQDEILKQEIKRYENRKRTQEVKDYYAQQVAELSYALNIPSDELVDKAKVGDRAQCGGSSAPRSILAVHLALIRTNAKYGDTPRFPFVIDTPQQQGQDPKNLKKMIEVLTKSASEDHQVILAVEALPDGVDVSDYSVINFSKPDRALTKDDFQAVAARVVGPLKAVRAAFEKERDELRRRDKS